MKPHKTRVSGFLRYMLLTATVMIVAFGWLFSPYIVVDKWWQPAASLFVFDRFLVDFLLFTLVGIWLINLPGSLRITGYAWFGILIISYTMQFMSVFITGQFVSRLAADNINHIALLLDWRSLWPFLVVLLALAGLVLTIEKRYCQRASWKSLIAASLLVLSLGVVFQYDGRWLPQEVTVYRSGIFQHKNNYIADNSPIGSLYRVFFSDRKPQLKPLENSEIAKAGKYGITISPDRQFPLIKDWIYRQPLPFKLKPGTKQRPNIIVFFAEGVAARTVNAYSSSFAGLTPNIADFARYGMKVNNYYNHTFATYRGLHGQLCSIYPTYGGIGGWQTNYKNLKNVSYYCLPDVLNEAGYRTMFLDTHRADAAFVDEMMRQLNFDEVITAEDISRQYLGGSEPMRDDALSDNQLVTGLVGILSEIEYSAEKSEPFFVGIYNLQTHVWQNITADGTRFGDGSNPILNTIHNYDVAFGEFWDYFKQSALFDNTIVILTADHTHFPNRNYVKLVGDDPDYVPVFVDRIPLIIYDPSRQLPQEFDANNASSIDFTPSLIHLLGLNNRPNPFLGRSIFDYRDGNSPNSGRSIAAAGNEIFLIDGDGVHKKGYESASTPSQRDELDLIDNLMSTIWQLEQNNRIWPLKKKSK